MGDKFTEGCLMSLIDDALRIISSDTTGDEIPFVSYSLREKDAQPAKREETALDALYREASSCHACSGYLSRSIFAESVARKGAKVLFIAPYPEGPVIFSSASLPVFRAWWRNSLLLEEREWALTTLIKCPVGSFSKEAADACRGILRTEMAEIAPEAMVIFGQDTAAYMLRSDSPMEKLRGKRFVVNHIPVFVTYSPMDYILNPSLKKTIWSDLLFIRRSIGTEGRNA